MYKCRIIRNIPGKFIWDCGNAACGSAGVVGKFVSDEDISFWEKEHILLLGI